MLRNQSVAVATTLVENLLRRGNVVAPKAETPIHGLVTSSIGLGAAATEFIGNIDSSSLNRVAYRILDNASDINVRMGLTSSDHDNDMDKAVKDFGKVLRGNIDIARNRAAPIVRDILERVGTTLAALQTVAIQTPIIADKLHDIYHDRYFDDILATESSGPIGEIELVGDMPSMELAGIRKLCVSGVSGFDKKVDDFINYLGADRLIEAYMVGFTNHTSADINFDRLSRDQLLAVFLMTRNLINPSVQKQIGVDVSIKRVATQGIFCATKVRNKVEMFKTYYEQGVMVLEWPERIQLKAGLGSAIVVHDDLYEEFLEAGGTPDCLYGALITTQIRTLPELLAGREKFTQAASTYIDGIASANSSKRDAAIKSGIQEGFAANVADDSNFAGRAVNRTEILAEVHNSLLGATAAQLGDTVNYVTELVCDLLFPKTYAKHLVTTMNRLQVEKPNACASDLCTMACLDLLIKYTVGCMVVKKIS